MTRPEILAPAGGPEAFEAALAAGADAVYLGVDGFNARRGAQNFSREDLPGLVRRCHIRGAKLYLTLNTLFLESERDAFLDLAQAACDAGVDAAIVQDLGAAALLRRCAPALRLHASTQMAVHNLQGAKLLEELGFSRLVPARECSAEELSRIMAGSPLELEVFVHGALCMCVSGQCYMSAMLGGRSGNRGLCAQPCRLPFISAATDHALSLKDLSLIPHMAQLQKLGIHSLKIEGRMKRPEYVAAAVTACRDALEGRPVDMDALQSVFSRSGFTDGYFTGKRGFSMFGIREKEDVQAAQKVLGKFAALYTDTKRHAQPVPVAMTFLMDETMSRLTVRDGDGNEASVEGQVPQTALHKPTDEARVRISMEKTGGTPYRLETLDCRIAPGLILPASALNDLRRRALEALEELRGLPHPIPFRPVPRQPVQPPQKTVPALRIDAAKVSQITPGMARGAELITLPMEELLHLPEDSFLWEQKEKLCALLPRMLWDPAPAEKAAGQLRERGVLHAQAGNLGTLRLAREAGFISHASPFLNAINAEALAELARLGAADILISFEAGLAAGGLERAVPLGLTAYGYLPLMTVRNCPVNLSVGCARCKSGENFITDRKGSRLRIRCARGCCEIENPVPLYLADRLEELRAFDFLTLRFTGEETAECQRLFREYTRGGQPPAAFTRGLLYRPLQ